MIWDCLINCLEHLYFCTYNYNHLWKHMECHGALLLLPTLCIPFCTIEDDKEVWSLKYIYLSGMPLIKPFLFYMYDLVNWSTTSEVIHWTGKRFGPRLSLLLKTQNINRSFSIISTELTSLQEEIFSWTCNISNLHPMLQWTYRLIHAYVLEWKDMRLFWDEVCSTLSNVLDVTVPCSLTVLLLNDTTSLKLTCWKWCILWTGITAAKKLVLMLAFH